MKRQALVIGATGGIGSETARALIAHGWTVRALARDPEAAARNAAWIGPATWVKGDALDARSVVAAAEGAAAIVHAVNPPGYKNWKGLQVPMLDSSIAAAKAVGARLVFPGNVYNYGPDAFPLVAEDAAQSPTTRKGAIRKAMEERLETAAREGARVLIVRAGDFFGPRAGNSWLAQGMVKAGRPLAGVSYPGKPDVGHAWAYLPDLADTIARLLDREANLAAFERFHFGGHWLERGGDMADAIRRAADAPAAKNRWFPWPAVYVAAAFSETFREMLEMRYLWSQAVKLDNRKLVAFLGAEPHTPLDEALRETLVGLGCVRESAPRFPAISSADG